MINQNLKRNRSALARTGHIFTGYDWTGTARAAVPAAKAEYELAPVADAREARRAWKQRAEDARRAAARRPSDASLERVATWAHARAPRDPCIGAGC